MWTLAGSAAVEVPVLRRGEAVDLRLPPFATYAAVELET